VHVILVAPEIHMNTGNIIRLCANTGTTLHLVEPLGFSMDSAALKRAGLDYHELAEVHVHPDFDEVQRATNGARLFAFSSRATKRYDSVEFGPTDAFVFGAERAGLHDEVLATFEPDRLLRLPMRPSNRSLNLANSVAVVVFEAWRQQDFVGSVNAGNTPDTGTADGIRSGLTTEHLALPPFDS
jgi:tRNA (cytidine/uridine-2'-O-)-methyltransferase